jgi:hypothetical protein
VTSASLACNGAPNTGFTSSSAKLSVQAGQTVSGAWLHTLTSTQRLQGYVQVGTDLDIGTGPDGEADNKVIDSSHKVTRDIFVRLALF